MNAPIFAGWVARVCEDPDCTAEPRFLILAAAVVLSESPALYNTLACDAHRADRGSLAVARICEMSGLAFCPIGPLYVPVAPGEIITAEAARSILGQEFLAMARRSIALGISPGGLVS